MGHQQVFRWKNDRPPSLEQFQTMFPDDWSCAAYLAKKRWPDGFVCPDCGCRKGWKLRGKPWVWECSGELATGDGLVVPCRKQTSVIANTIMHKTHLPLRTWFLAAQLVATHSNGISALQLQAKLGIGSYKSAWLLLHKLRRVMVDPNREPLGGPGVIVQVDETEMPFRRKTDPHSHASGRRKTNKIIIGGAVERLDDGKMGRARLEVIGGWGRADVHPFVLNNTLPGSIIQTDGNKSYRKLPDREHDEIILPKYVPAHIVLPQIHRLFSMLKRWAMGVYHGLRPEHADIYLQEFVFRFNRRRHYRSSFDRLLGLGMASRPQPYESIIANRFLYMVKKWLRQRSRSWEDKDRLLHALVLQAGMSIKEAREIVAIEPWERGEYRRRGPVRPVLAKERTAFVYATY